MEWGASVRVGQVGVGPRPEETLDDLCPPFLRGELEGREAVRGLLVEGIARCDGLLYFLDQPSPRRPVKPAHAGV